MQLTLREQMLINCLFETGHGNTSSIIEVRQLEGGSCATVIAVMTLHTLHTSTSSTHAVAANFLLRLMPNQRIVMRRYGKVFFIALICIAQTLDVVRSNTVTISNNVNFISTVGTNVASNTLSIALAKNPSEAVLISKRVCSSECCYMVSQQLEINGEVDISGKPNDFCTLSAHDDTRVFKVESTGILRVSQLRLNHGRGDKGGAMFIHGQFFGEKVMFADNVASIIGGAVYVSDGGAFECKSCNFFNNAANTIINGNDKVGASVFGQRYSKVSCSSCNIDNSTKSHQQVMAVSREQQFVFAFDWKALNDL